MVGRSGCLFPISPFVVVFAINPAFLIGGCRFRAAGGVFLGLFCFGGVLGGFSRFFAHRGFLWGFLGIGEIVIIILVVVKADCVLEIRGCVVFLLVLGGDFG